MPVDSTALSIIGFKSPAPPSDPDKRPPDDGTRPIAQRAAHGRNGGIFGGLGDNPLFTGGLAIAALTTGFQLLRKTSVRAVSLARRRMLVTVEIPSSDESYGWFLHFLAEHQHFQTVNPGTRTSESTSRPPVYTLAGLFARFQPAPRELAVETRTMKTPNGTRITDFVLVPGQGKHIINYNSTLMQVSRQRDSKHINLSDGTPFETIEITTLYTRRAVLSELLRESQQSAQQRTEGKTIVFNSWGTEWRPFGNPQRKRSLESVILAAGTKEKVMNDVRDFLASADWYRDRGIPYRRGYLLHGPPGTGKTSFVKAMAGDLDYNICIVNLYERGLTDDRLNHLLTNLPERSIALLEDVDAAFANRTQPADDGYRGANVTFSGLLNALDGAASGEDRILVLTTNHPNRLDEALLRPGRVDLKMEIGYATPEVVEGMWERFYGSTTLVEDVRPRRDEDRLKQKFLGTLYGGRVFEPDCQGISTAELQGLFLCFKNNPAGAVQAAENLVPAAQAIR